MALTSRLVTFKSWWLSPKKVQIRLYRQTPLPSKRGLQAASHLRCLRRDRADRRRDEDRQDRARLIATLSDCVTAKRRRRAAPAAAVTGAAARAPEIRTGSFGFASVGSPWRCRQRTKPLCLQPVRVRDRPSAATWVNLVSRSVFEAAPPMDRIGSSVEQADLEH
jgi:hypothetical protein